MIGSDPNPSRNHEEIGFVVVEAGSYNLSGIPLVAGKSGKNIRGVGNSSNGDTVPLSGLAQTEVAIVTLQGMAGADGGWAVLIGANSLTPNELKVAIDEDQQTDLERNHAAEVVAYLVFGQSRKVLPSPIHSGVFNRTPQSAIISWVDSSGIMAPLYEIIKDGSIVYAGKEPFHILTQIDADTRGEYGILIKDTEVNRSDTVWVGLQPFDPALAKLSFESGYVTADDTWQKIDFNNTYYAPIIIASGVLPDNTSLPAVSRIRNLDRSGFELKLQNPGNLGSLSSYDVYYVVIEAGIYDSLHYGIQMEAMRGTASYAAHSSNWLTEARTPVLGFNQPVVLGQVMSHENEDWSVFWASANDPTASINAEEIHFGMHVGEDSQVGRSPESIGWMIIERGEYAAGGVDWLVASGPKTVRGPDYGTGISTYSLGDFQAAIAIVSADGMAGANGGWPVLMGDEPLADNQLDLSFDEDQITDPERRHGMEKVAYLALGRLGPQAGPPPNLFASNRTPQSVILYWEREENISYYSLFDGDTLLGTFSGNSHLITGLSPEAIYSYTLTATDENGITSAPANITVDPFISGSEQLTYENGIVDATANWQSIQLQQTYRYPIVISTANLLNTAGAPILSRVKVTGPATIEIRLQNPSGEDPGSHPVHYLVVEGGIYEQGVYGVNMEARRVTSTETANKSAWVLEDRNYQLIYSQDPVILGQVMSEHDPSWSVFWAAGESRNAIPSYAGTDFTAGKHTAEDFSSRQGEELGILILESGAYDWGNGTLVAGRTRKEVQGTGNLPNGYEQAVIGLPNIASAQLSINGMAGADGGWPLLIGPEALGNGVIRMAIDEDQVADAERAHAKEYVAYIAFAELGANNRLACPASPKHQLPVTSFSAPTSSPHQNHIISTSFRHPDTGKNIQANRDWTTVDYLDGLGRPIQQIEVQASPSGADRVQSTKYDAYGRTPVLELPFTANTYGAFVNDGAVEGFYANVGLTGDITNPWAVTQFEASPLNRQIEQGAPGGPWQPDPATPGTQSSGEHSITTEYRTNATPSPGFDPSTFELDASYYPAHSLLIIRSYDENGSMTERAKDIAGKTIYVSSQVSGSPTETPLQSEDFATTFYVYDRFGNLRYVLQPEGWQRARIVGLHFELLEDYCFQYRYDRRQRVKSKKIPGADWVDMVYDPLDRVIATRDGNLREEGKWLITTYDYLGRPQQTGFMFDGRSQPELQALADGGSALPVQEILSTTYYDDYSFLNDPRYAYNADHGRYISPSISPLATNNLGRVTGVQISILNPQPGMPSSLLTVTYYDTYGRELQTIADNHLGTLEIVSNSYNFAGELLESVLLHQYGSPQPVRVHKRFSYDHRSRLIRLAEQLNQAPPVILAEYLYDELGQLKEKNLGASNCGNFLQSVDYAYNIRGWMTHINQVGVDGGSLVGDLQNNDAFSDIFSQSLFYEGAEPGALHNGNLSALHWEMKSGDPVQDQPRSYRFSYDLLNRLKEANFMGPDGEDYSVKGIRYDLNGNILSLQRQGAISALEFGTLDQLTYHYDSGNQLHSVIEDTPPGSLPGADEFKQSSHYRYDASGNGVFDRGKSLIYRYNHLNKPISAGRVDQKGASTWIYAADGTKLRQLISGADPATHDYVGGFFYKQGILQSLQHEEGRALKLGEYFRYEYNLTDHLGNVRVSFSDVNQDGVLDLTAQGILSEVLQIDHYYPFGMRLGGLSYSAGTENRYRYNGKELHRELGLGWYDYGARMYDPAIGRWNGVDALAEIMVERSPFNYVFNNPMRFIDPDGMMPSDSVKLKPAPEKDGSADAGTLDEVVITAKRAKGEKNGQNRSHRVATTLLGPVPSGSKARGRKISSFAVQDMVQAPAMQGVLDLSYDMLTSTLFAIQLSMGGTGMAPVNQMALKTTLRSFPTAKMVNLRVINAARGAGNLAKTPVGRSGNVMKVLTKNSPTTIGGRKFTGHALDQMQSRGILSPRAVLDVIKNPARTFPGNTPGTSVFIRDNLKVITNKAGDIITVIPQ